MDLAEVKAALETAISGEAFTARGRVVEVHRVRRSCYFALSDGRVELDCAMLRRQAARTDFWVRVGQEVEVTGYAERFRGRWQLLVAEARLIKTDASLAALSAALRGAPSDRLYTTRGRVAEVHRVRRSCYFTLVPGEDEGRTGEDVVLHCALLRRNAMRLDFWVTAGQEIEVTGHAERFRGRWQLYAMEARLLRGESGWPRRYRYRSARRIVVAFDELMDALFGSTGTT
jgi:exonuclease VII large subunit